MILHNTMCFCGHENFRWYNSKTHRHTHTYFSVEILSTYGTAVFQNSVCELAVSFCLDLTVCGTHKFECSLYIPTGLIHVSYAVFTVVSDILRGSTRQNSEECQLNICHFFWKVWVSIAELWWKHKSVG